MGPHPATPAKPSTPKPNPSASPLATRASDVIAHRFRQAMGPHPATTAKPSTAKHNPSSTPAPVASGLAPRRAAQQPQKQAPRSTRKISISYRAAAPPNAGQARSPREHETAFKPYG